VTFGDTKEGSFGLRVNESMKVERKTGGKIVSSEGLEDEKAWGKPAAWVDYYGPIQGETLGIAILNHPSSFRYPTHWHVRPYGLFAANPWGLHDFTGGKEHNIVMRHRAIERGLRLNEYGLFRSKTETRDPKLLESCKTEEEIFAKLGLKFVPPEMREDMGEFKLAEKGEIPRLIEWTELKGSLHNHSTWSDGHQRPQDIAKAMRQLGLAYWGVTDHSKASFQANGLDAARLREQLKEIKQINEQLAREGTDFRLLTGTEVDILKDGKLDYPDDVLAELDVVIASIHQSFSQSEEETTNRLIGAARNPYAHILGHLTGRLLLERDAYKVNQHTVIDACAETGTWIELNASPYRFDMDWRFWPYAKSKGVKCVINCDAHRFEHAGFLRLGAGIARKGWLTKDDVVNTLPLKESMKELGKKRAKLGK